jgi:hypothetical protein
MLLTAINCYGIGEIRSGSEIASYTVAGNFEYLPKNLAFYNYEIIFSRIDHSKIAIEVHNYFKQIKDIPLSSDIKNRQKKTLFRN